MPLASPDDQPVTPADGMLPGGAAHRRGAGINPTHRFSSTTVVPDAAALEAAAREQDPDRPRRVRLTLHADASRRVLHRVHPLYDVPFGWTLNPYSGCEHGCTYCYARPYHGFLGFSSGLDFETQLIVKDDAPAQLERELALPGWKADTVVMSAITDLYQPIERDRKLGRACLEVLTRCRQPVVTMTKGTLVRRDIDLWQELAAHGAGRVVITLVTLDPRLAAALEPRAAAPAARLRVIRDLAQAGVPVGVNVAPVIPGLTDSGLPDLLAAVAEAGATTVAWSMLRLPDEVEAIFFDALRRDFGPDRVAGVKAALRDVRGGALHRGGATRHRGTGARAQQTAQWIRVLARKHHLGPHPRALDRSHFRRPDRDAGQGRLFG